ncbi:MAG TPA: hypothetical protein VJA21_02770 [Verrucomicrobiae bacterium]
MKTNPIKHLAATFVPAALLAITGCRTPPNPLAAQTTPALTGGRTVVETSHRKAVVAELVPGKSELALRSSSGATMRCKIAPQVDNLNQIHVGARVNVTLTDRVTVFLCKNGTPPGPGTGTTVTTGTSPSGQAASVVLQTTDARAKVLNVDRSYRLLKLEYEDGRTKEYKFSLPDTLENIQKGDEALVRTTEPLAICLKTK